MNCKRRLPTAVLIGLLTAIGAASTERAHADTATAPAPSRFQNLQVQVEGKGPAMVFIPGLNSASGTFTETCAAFKAQYSCHLLHLPGFAGNAPLANVGDGFLPAMRDQIIAYVKANKLEKPVLVGHSLGGVLNLMIVEKEPALAKALVIVDSLPFFAAIQNPAATADGMKPMAENMKRGMLAQPREQYVAGLKQNLRGMSRLPERLPTLEEWGASSDPATTAQAMADMYTTDLRGSLAQIKTPTLVLGAWAAYAQFGSTKASTEAIYRAQYEKLQGVDIRMSDTGYHFLTWDDPQWLTQQMASFLNRS